MTNQHLYHFSLSKFDSKQINTAPKTFYSEAGNRDLSCLCLDPKGNVPLSQKWEHHYSSIPQKNEWFRYYLLQVWQSQIHEIARIRNRRRKFVWIWSQDGMESKPDLEKISEQMLEEVGLVQRCWICSVLAANFWNIAVYLLNFLLWIDSISLVGINLRPSICLLYLPSLTVCTSILAIHSSQVLTIGDNWWWMQPIV